MAKRMKFDEASDSDELQALFDSIASTQAEPEPVLQRPVPAPAAAPETDDNDELQALFDSVAAEFDESTSAAPDAQLPEPAPAAAEQDTTAPEAVFNRIGQMTRKVHDSLLELGFDSALQEVAQAMPDARQRLTYIAQMTEQAASRVLNATDVAKPIQDKLESDADALRAKWDRLYANELSVEEFKALAGETRGFLSAVSDGSRATNAQLLEIMMAQDFQDLTGQVIKKVVDMAQTLESQLLEVLLEVAPAEKRKEKNAGLMNGPVVSSEGRDDVVTSQGQVDDLLESLGF
ncbi:protein phosphatase CheZ [Parazoarcus communis]|uniref:Protein phosphatase CheZ n=1 Tax=Parazoarcus communis TaxID=41977 RepID=A0A2U8H743_9RHOO|nr:protein phosphatase CheZ [Parazoarcus communis]AWI81581.1 protein phosphatase CheZ [Parazoarcus communis]